jgi:acetyl/propionyl-CoA carboxylase alpha subunit
VTASAPSARERRHIGKLLVANRGEIAERVLRTARSMGIATVAVFSDPDAGAPFARDADEAVRLPGSAPADTYLSIPAILGAVAATGADAVHPGYGFLSERAELARACAAAGVTFVGPTPEAIEAMGSKVAAKALMERAGVPVLPGATVHPGDDIAALAGAVGFPLLVKAVFGGGGRGMRVVEDPAELPDAVASAEREAAAAFGDGTVFLERYVVDPRHVEVQVFGDTHGNVIHLFERECSVQRRYQKIIEEAPSPAVDAARRDALGHAAVAAAKALGYVGAGTVEFVMDRDGDFSFLEVNTRLQVEHPVTEMATGLDLVRLQLLVAQGEPLPDDAVVAAIDGHAIEARLYAEDVAAGFLPTSGPIHRLRVPQPEGVRVDAGYEDGSVVSPFYDAMVAKVVAWAPTRVDAARRLADVLATAQIHGVVTNRDLLVGVLRHPEFLAGRTDTGFLVRHDPVILSRAHVDPRARPLHAVAATIAGQAERRAAARVLAALPSGWRNVRSGIETIAFEDGEGTLTVGYVRHGSVVDVQLEGDPVAITAIALGAATAERVELTVNGVRRVVDTQRVDDMWYVDSILGASVFRELPRFPDSEVLAVAGSLVAPLPGTVVRVEVAVGARVERGATIVVLEAMKLEHRIQAPHGGTVSELHVAVGARVDTGAVLAVVDEHDDDAEARADSRPGPV